MVRRVVFAILPMSTFGWSGWSGAAQRAAQNIGHNQARMAFMARPR
jgi:hypothetical protein